jgi:hypothetical protein
VLALLDERRNNLVTQQPTCLVNQLHALLRDLLPGGARADSSGGVPLLKATPLNVRHVTSAAGQLGCQAKPRGCLAVSDITADSVACRARRRLESAKPGIFRQLPRSLVIG